MCLFAARAPSKTAPALLSPSPTSTKPNTLGKHFFKFKVTCKGLVKFSLPFLYFGLLWLLVPQACASPQLSSCPLDPSASPYSLKVMHEQPCYFRCLQLTYYIMFIPFIIFGLALGLHGYLYRRKIYARIAERRKIHQTLSSLMGERNMILEIHEQVDITA